VTDSVYQANVFSDHLRRDRIGDARDHIVSVLMFGTDVVRIGHREIAVCCQRQRSEASTTEQ